MDITDLLRSLGVPSAQFRDGDLAVRSPIDGSTIARVAQSRATDVSAAVLQAADAFSSWRTVPPPKRGELVRLFAEELRANKDDLGRLVSIECGKILSEGRGEVQEMIDICDFAVGLSRQLYGQTIASERPGHHMVERWHPLGPVGVISAFNFPVAVWAWNAALAWVCGDTVLWKASEKTPLCALACQALFERAATRYADAPAGLSAVLTGGRAVGEQLAADERVPLISATGSTPMGRAVGSRVAARFGRTILELGGNAAMTVAPSADLELALRAIVFAAAGTAGQRCTTLRRLLVHEDVYAPLLASLHKAYASLVIGDPLQAGTLVGPLIDADAFHDMAAALERARAEGANVFGGERISDVGTAESYYVRPALVEMAAQTALVHTETFAPILYLLRYRDLAEAIALNNAVPQGLSSCIFTTDLRESETFLSATGSDCGIANVNIGSSGAEIGGAVGGAKETGGGRESGSDAWKGYMRRQTQTINYSRDLPLAQGVVFDLG